MEQMAGLWVVCAILAVLWSGLIYGIAWGIQKAISNLLGGGE